MGILNKYYNHDSSISPSPSDSGRIQGQPNVLGATKQSKLHAFGEKPGYSLNGAFKTEVNGYDTTYDNGGAFPLPQPSGLDLNGETPKKYANPESGFQTANQTRTV